MFPPPPDSSFDEPAPAPRRDRLALIVLALGAIAVVLAAAPYKSFELDRYFVPKELVLHIVATVVALLMVLGRRRFTLSTVDLLLVAFLVCGAISAALSINGWVAQRAWMVSLSGAALFWTTSALRRDGLVRPLLFALAAGVVVGAATSLAQAYGVTSEYFSLNRAPGGTFGNRNFIAHLAAMGTPIVLLVALTARQGAGALLGVIGMAVVAATLVMSRSRAAWLAVIVSAVPVLVLAFLLRSRWREPRTTRRLVVLGVAAVIGLGAAIVLPNRLEWKSDSPYLDSAAGLVNYKEGSGRGRLVQWSNSVRMMRSDPLFGVGPGNWAVVYPKFASRNDPSLSQEDGMTANPWPSSDWVAILSERGVLGIGLLLAAMFGLFGRTLRDFRRSTEHDPERVLTAIALVGTLAATAVVGAFDAVLLLAVPTYFFWTIAGALAPPASGGVEWTRGTRLLPAIAAVLGAIAILRSSTQTASMATYAANSRISGLARAALLDPGAIACTCGWLTHISHVETA